MITVMVTESEASHSAYEKDRLGKSIINEIDCVEIGKELDSNIECRIILNNYVFSEPPSDIVYDEKNNVLIHEVVSWHSKSISENIVEFRDEDGEKMDSPLIKYFEVDLNKFEVTNVTECEVIITGTYVQEITIPCQPIIENEETPRELNDCSLGWSSCVDSAKLANISSHIWEGCQSKSGCVADNHFQISSTTEPKFVYFTTVKDSHSYPEYLSFHVVSIDKHWLEGDLLEPPKQFHTYKFDISCPAEDWWSSSCMHGAYVGPDVGLGASYFHNEELNKIYFFYNDLLYVINGMGETGLSVSMPIEPEPEPISISEGSSEGGGCLIATAAFGSEMAPQVQFLREIRDNTVMNTQSGTAFMNGFNQFYYSFSPAVADYERENPVFKEMVKVTLAPLLTSLTLLNYVDVDTEEEMLGYGIGIILLNIGMYFVAPAVIIVSLKKRLFL